MPPVMNRIDTRNRAERAWRLRCAGRTWQEVADTVGFKSRRSAHLAVDRLLRKDPPEDVAVQRKYTAEGYRLVQAALFEALAKAREPHTVVSVSRAITDVMDRRAKLLGLHVPVAQEINLTVQQSAAAVLDRAQDELLALEQAGRTLPILDAEVVEDVA